MMETTTEFIDEQRLARYEALIAERFDKTAIYREHMRPTWMRRSNAGGAK